MKPVEDLLRGALLPSSPVFFLFFHVLFFFAVPSPPPRVVRALVLLSSPCRRCAISSSVSSFFGRTAGCAAAAFFLSGYAGDDAAGEVERSRLVSLGTASWVAFDLGFEPEPEGVAIFELCEIISERGRSGQD